MTNQITFQDGSTGTIVQHGYNESGAYVIVRCDDGELVWMSAQEAQR